MSGFFFNPMKQAVLLFGAETGVLNPRMERALGNFQHWGSGGSRGDEGNESWEYPTLEEAMVEVGFERIGEYIMRSQNTVA